MTLADAIAAAGMTPPKAFADGRWIRFPGIGKGRSNRAGWCRVITPTLAIYGDWSSNFSATWIDDDHRDDETSRRLLREARVREQRFAAEQKQRQQGAARQAQQMLSEAIPCEHPYLARKGFPHLRGLVRGENLLIPVRDAQNHRLISLQQISAEGEKRFLPGARVKGGVHRLGANGKAFLCEGYATGLSIYEAARRLHRNPATVVCFSAANMETVAQFMPKAIVCADRDASGVGEQAARRTSLPWILPPELGDFNDLHCQRGLRAVVDILRAVP